MVESGGQSFEVARLEFFEEGDVLPNRRAGQLHGIQHQAPIPTLKVEDFSVELRATQKMYRGQFREAIAEAVAGPSPMPPIMHKFERIRFSVEIKFERNPRAAAGMRDDGTIALIVVGEE